jgi:lipopolysaccharide biosynthesis regulator YciM
MQALVRLYTEARDFERAIAMARRLARAKGEDSSLVEAGLYVDMADAARAEGRSSEARRAAKRALRKGRALVRGWITLGELEAERGRTKAALAAWLQVPKIDRRSGPLVYPQLEATYAALGRPRDFEKFLRELLREKPEDLEARLALARTLSARGESDAATAEIRAILDKNGDDLAALAMLGRSFLAEGRDAEASRLLAELLDSLDRRGLLHAAEQLE